jgi:NAD(P)-dependent dehydrogenase (short-subunit alcohol dehydrogenase family)
MPTILISGASRGIGLELARQYAGAAWTVIATARTPGDMPHLAGNVRVEALDVADFGAVAGFGERLGGKPIDLLIANAGVWGPERIEGAADAEAWGDALRVNTIAPVLLARSVYANVSQARGKLVAITSRMGSIADNSSGGYMAYRSTKAGLNAAWKSLSIEAARDGVIAAVLHPGWVQTRMGGSQAPLSPEQSVAAMRRTIEALGPGQAGAFLDHDGTPLPW